MRSRTRFRQERCGILRQHHCLLPRALCVARTQKAAQKAPSATAWRILPLGLRFIRINEFGATLLSSIRAPHDMRTLGNTVDLDNTTIVKNMAYKKA